MCAEPGCPVAEPNLLQMSAQHGRWAQVQRAGDSNTVLALTCVQGRCTQQVLHCLNPQASNIQGKKAEHMQSVSTLHHIPSGAEQQPRNCSQAAVTDMSDLQTDVQWLQSEQQV